MARRKELSRKLRYAKKLKENRTVPFWVILRKFGRLVHPYRIKVPRNWRHNKIKL